MEHIIGETFRFFALIMVCWGVPRQIIKQYKDNRFGMDFYFSLVICAVYFFRAWYGILKNDWYIIVPNIIGLLLCIVVSYQYFNPRPFILRTIAKLFKKKVGVFIQIFSFYCNFLHNGYLYSSKESLILIRKEKIKKNSEYKK